MEQNSQKYLSYIDTLNNIGIALSAEKDHQRLLEKILTSAMELTNADGATLYLITKDQKLAFEIFANRTLKIKPQKITETGIQLPSIPLYDASGKPNLNNIASFCVIKNKTQNIEDAYQVQDFDFSGMRLADKKLGYRSKSFLTIPLRNHENKIIGVLQLINAVDEKTGAIISFSEESVHLAESLASQAAIALTKEELLQAQKDLFEALIQLIAKAIDEKSPYTSNHCTRVPILTQMIAEAVNKATTGHFKDFSLTKEQLEELRIAAWLHDCGKIITPEYVVDKATKLHTLSDRMEVVDLRFEILKRDLKIALLEKKLNLDSSAKKALDQTFQQSIAPLTDAEQFLKTVNQGGEFLAEEEKDRIRELAKNYYSVGGQQYPLLSDQDVDNLCVSKGTLNDKERDIINNHVTVTQKLLASLPYPEYLKNVPEIAGAHHEHMDGSGYPKGLVGEQMLAQSRMVAIADVFEALTAADRPYKDAKPLSEVLKIMTRMKDNGHLDPDLFDLFVREKLYLTYAKQYLKPEQIDIA